MPEPLEYGVAGAAVVALSYAVAALASRRNGKPNSKLEHVLERQAQAYERLALAMEKQTALLEQQGRMLERIEGRVDDLWREVSRA